MADPDVARKFAENNGEKVIESATRRVLRALRARHNEISYNGGRRLPKWAFFEEILAGCGFNQQGIDAWAIGIWPSTRHRIYAYEVKVSRSDFMAEMRKPSKRLAGLNRSNEFYFAAPTGLIKPNELPRECGLIEVGPRGGSKIVVPAPHRDVDLPIDFIAMIAKRSMLAVAS